jgi:hypothetical protein
LIFLELAQKMASYQTGTRAINWSRLPKRLFLRPMCQTLHSNRSVQPLQAAQSLADRASPNAIAPGHVTPSDARARRLASNATRVVIQRILNVRTNNSVIIHLRLSIMIRFIAEMLKICLSVALK